jgi:starch synthase (maltosyl-transferring)
MTAPPSRVLVDAVSPEVDGGRYPAKRTLGESLVVEADIVIDGHDALAAVLLDRPPGAERFRETPMRPIGNDRYRAEIRLSALGRHAYTVEAFPDRFATWADFVRRKAETGADLALEAVEGAEIVEACAARATPLDRGRLTDYAGALRRAGSAAERVALARDPELAALCARFPDRTGAARYPRELEVVVEPERARFAAWYELFPRSQAREPGRHGTFADVERRLADIREMGFDVIYLPPIHPIGRTARKGRDNALVAAPGDPGSPWAIGGEGGGHRDVHPELGTVADFERLAAAARTLGMEIALDLAFQCSPDHPYVREHPEWFVWRPDGTIAHAENPPKKYQDIVPFDFTGPAWESLWRELRDVVLLWIGRGVRTFRVDNPHTKPIAFWEWLIAEVKARHPDTVFLSEAFTRPKLMRALAKVGFSQSYTYFTWRNWKGEIEAYLGELASPPVSDYFRASFWPSTPDILPEILQRGGEPAFRMRLVLAATLAPLYGIYGGYEFCEGDAVPGTEEYRRSEKYEIRQRDWRSAPLRGLLSRLNRIRREHPALQFQSGLRFLPADDPRVLFFERACGDDVLLVAVSLDPFEPRDTTLEIPLERFGIGEDEAYEALDLMSGDRHVFVGRRNRVRLDPARNIAAVHEVRRLARTEAGFDYY